MRSMGHLAPFGWLRTPLRGGRRPWGATAKGTSVWCRILANTRKVTGAMDKKGG